VFCASLADVFDTEAPDEWRNDLWDLISTTKALTWLLLTKRIGNVAKMLPPLLAEQHGRIWIGATIVNAEEKTERPRTRCHSGFRMNALQFRSDSLPARQRLRRVLGDN
jgi:protein gp37